MAGNLSRWVSGWWHRIKIQRL